MMLILVWDCLDEMTAASQSREEVVSSTGKVHMVEYWS